MRQSWQRASWAASCLALILACLAGGAIASPAATLKVALKVDVDGPMYIEGAIYYLRAERNGHAVTKRLGATTTFRLAPGRYRLRSWARPCDGNCGYLDPPTDRCSATIRLRASRTTRLRITASAGSPCRIVRLSA